MRERKRERERERERERRVRFQNMRDMMQRVTHLERELGPKDPATIDEGWGEDLIES